MGRSCNLSDCLAVDGWFQRVYRVLRFPQAVQKHTLGEVGTWMVVWWPVVSGIFLPTILRQVAINNVGHVFIGTQCRPTFAKFEGFFVYLSTCLWFLCAIYITRMEMRCQSQWLRHRVQCNVTYLLTFDFNSESTFIAFVPLLFLIYI